MYNWKTEILGYFGFQFFMTVLTATPTRKKKNSCSRKRITQMLPDAAATKRTPLARSTTTRSARAYRWSLRAWWFRRYLPTTLSPGAPPTAGQLCLRRRLASSAFATASQPC
jgi:hypothetical protein